MIIIDDFIYSSSGLFTALCLAGALFCFAGLFFYANKAAGGVFMLLAFALIVASSALPSYAAKDALMAVSLACSTDLTCDDVGVVESTETIIATADLFDGPKTYVKLKNGETLLILGDKAEWQVGDKIISATTQRDLVYCATNFGGCGFALGT